MSLVNLGNIIFAPTQGPNDTVQWSGTGVSANGQFVSPGVGLHPITLHYTVSPGCDTSKTFIVEVAPFVAAQAGQDATICSSQGTFMPSPTPSEDAWYDTSGAVVTPPFNVLPGTYKYTYTIQAGTPCESSDDLNLTVVGGNAVDAGSDRVVCETEINLALPAAPGLIWSGPSLNGNTIDILSLNPGYYNYALNDTTLPASNHDSLQLEVATPTVCAVQYSRHCLYWTDCFMLQLVASGVESLVDLGRRQPRR